MTIDVEQPIIPETVASSSIYILFKCQIEARITLAMLRGRTGWREEVWPQNIGVIGS